MKLARFGAPGRERPGLVDRQGVRRDLSGEIADITPAQLAPQALASLSSLDPSRLPIVSSEERVGMPVTGTRKFLGIGMNYTDYAAAAQRPHPAEPVLFTKAISCLQGPSDDVMLPQGSTQTDWEVELGVVIGSRARYVEESHALQHVAGYCIVNDLSERDFHNNRGGTLDKGKGCDTFGPIGPWLVTRDEIRDPQAVDLWLEVNGRERQRGSTAHMIFTVPWIIAYLSRFLTLEPGDIVTTGTPAGVGLLAQPPVYLEPGDVMRLGSDRLGVQEQRVIAWRPDA